jgi:hypothetical protein
MTAVFWATWIHVLCMVGLFGGLLVVQLALPSQVRNDADIARRITRLLSILLGIGLLAGLAGYGLKQGHLMGGHFNGVIGLKFVILLMVGGLLPLTRKEGRGDRVRWILLALLAFAVLSALTLRHV